MTAPLNPRRLKIGESATFRYLRHGEPLPEGATLAHDLGDTHHGRHSVLVELAPEPRRPS